MFKARNSEQWLMAAISLLLALLLWVYVVGQKSREWPYAVRVELKLASSEIQGKTTPSKVTLHLKGPRRTLDRISPNDLRVRLDLATREPGEHARIINPDMVIGIPPRTEIVRIEPSEVRVELQPVRSKRVPVVSRLRVVIDTTMVLRGGFTVEPSRVEVRGTPSRLSRVSEVVTEEGKLEGKPGIWSEKMKIEVPEGIRVYPPFVDVGYEVKRVDEYGDVSE
ncbi:MAG: hypothetical protein JKX97_03040 [Candidatus Lindowbacteria bacterium]|nr:hypothetical protein [Candidatus Lindowbacteria bacterium]